MYLKRIVLHGFKSFANRSEFEFGPGLTSIVGPNGCGKSNVLDAVRWVLGEQSARSLRGAKMSDVVFAGSLTRKPAEFAEVQLTFNDCRGGLATDQDEVVISRLLFAGGHSEYRLNGNVCRLKDIRDLFLDTGVGVDAYSAIEQGRVDVLLAASPLERREIFEEAAGISRYKVQRTEAQRKLERTRENLLRLHDVMGELEKRLRSVKLAAGKARNFLEYDTRLRELQASSSLATYHSLEQARAAEATRHTALFDEWHARRTALATAETETAELERQRQALDEAIQAAEAQLAALRTEQSALAERIVQGERRIVDLGETRARRSAQSQELADRAIALGQRIAEEDTALRSLVAEVEHGSGHAAALQEARTQVEQQLASARQALEEAQRATFEAARRSALLHNERGNLEQQERRLLAQDERLSARSAELERERDELAARRTGLEHAATSLEQQAAELAGELRQIEERAAELAAQMSAVGQHISAVKEARSGVLSRLSLLEELERRLEGVDEGTRLVLAWREQEGHIGSVVGLVADLLRIDDPRVALLQPVLSTFENHVVVRDTYAFLAELNRRGELPGPVRVIALDRLPAERPLARYGDAPGFVARAAEWVTCREEFRPLAEHLLGRAIVVDCLERALALADGAPDGFVFLTPHGEMVGTRGQLGVGVSRDTPGLISRKAQIRQLRAELDEVETQLERVQRQHAELERATSDAQVQRGALWGQIATVQRRHADVRAEITRWDDHAQRTERERLAVGGERAGVRRSLDELRARLHELQVENVAVEQAQREHESRSALLDQQLDEFQATAARLAQELTETLVELGRSTERRAGSVQTLDELRARLTILDRERQQGEREADEAARNIAAAESDLASARARQVQAAAEGEQCEAHVARRREERLTIRGRQETCVSGMRALRVRIEEIETALRDCDVALREAEVRKENLMARVRDELALDLAALYASYAHAEHDGGTIAEEIEELRQKITRLGNVNLDALAELEELSPRYENMVQQRQDLEDAIGRLQALITELDHQSQARFVQAFEQIRGHFQGLFRKLFGGGKADIILENPDDPLECGLEIIARPPGKEPQSISLLSGGEKTLTAVALLLAVFKSKPSPFAILDEVDAALDESNIERFNNVLEEFLTHSQFIVITHNKRTMQCADVLYGVTMEEAGVSQRVAVRFEDCVEAPYVA